MYALATKQPSGTNVSLPTLEILVGEFEQTFGLSETIAVYDVDGHFVYGARDKQGEPTCSCSVEVYGQPFVTLQLYADTDDGLVQRALNFLATSISQVATETRRRDQMADEVLARYDELNLIYELGMKFAQGSTQDEIVEFVLMETNRIVHADAGAIYVWDAEKANIIPASYFGHKSNPEFWGGRLRELALSTLYAYDQAQLFEADQIICAPLRFNDELLGALLLVYEHDTKRFRANDVNLVTTLTQNTALFIYVARLVEKLAHEKRQLENTLTELQTTKDKLSRNERLSIVGQTVGSLVHDMRKPLSNVMGYAGLLQEPDLSVDERQEFAGQIIKYIQVFSDMAQEVLDYTSGDAGVNLAPIGVEKFMSYVSDLLNPPGLERDTKIIIDFEAAKGRSIQADAQRFMRVFQNLVNNAIDAIESKGGSQVEVKVVPDGNLIRFTVTDDGPGVPEKIIRTLFEPFVTLEKSNGTGLGLAIVDRMVQVHGGKITYERAPGGGACFSFSVPQFGNGMSSD
ncbi:MAG: ATP-binding protein [Anaerolineae bacterium]